MKPNTMGLGYRVVSFAGLCVMCGLALLGLSCDKGLTSSQNQMFPDTPGNPAQVALFEDDFEAAELVNWSEKSSTGIALVTTPVHSGRYSFASTVSGKGNAGIVSPALKLPNPSYARFYFLVPAETSVSQETVLAGFMDAGYTAMERVHLARTGGDLTITTDHGSAAVPVTKGVWHALEAKLKSGMGSGELTIYLDGTQILTSTGLNIPAMTFVQIGQVTDSASGTIFFDDVAVSSVSNGAPSAYVNVRHASPHARSALRLMTVVWGQSAADSILVELGGKEVYRSSGPISGVEYPTIDLVPLEPGDYTLKVELTDGSGVRKAVHTESLHKDVAGMPSVAIDEWNNLVMNGKKFFPITTWSRSPADTNEWFRSGYINASGWSSGWAETYSTQQYAAFLDEINCMPTIGPSASRMGGTGDDASKAAAYAAKFAVNPCILMWAFYDEPSINDISSEQARATMKAVQSNDPNHPVAINLYGYDGVQDNKTKGYVYPTLVADVYSFDEYPVNGGLKIRDWVDHIDTFQRFNYGLTPWFVVTELGDNKTGHPLSAAQLRMEVWLAIIHGIKGITWWDSEDWINLLPENQAQAAILVSEITQLQNVILSPEPPLSVVSDRNVGGSRVDVMVRQDAMYIWVFAARLTEASEAGTPPLTATISISGLRDGTAAVQSENRVVNVNSGRFTDEFSPFGVHIYRIRRAGN